MELRTIIAVACLLSAVSAAAAKDTCSGHQAQRAVENLIFQKKYPPPSLGILVQDAGTGTTIVAINADSFFNPASVTKVVTAALAYDLLGLDYCAVTQVFTDSIEETGAAVTVRNCYLRGNGDPGFTAERLWLFVEHLYHRGIRTVTGDLVLDDYFFDSVAVGPGFGEDTSSRAYQPLISALAMNFNTVAVHCRPGAAIGRPAVVDLFPEMNGITVAALASTASPGRRKILDIATAPAGGTTLVTVKGSLGIDEPGEYTYRKLWQTWESFGNALLPLLAKRGIAFRGNVVHGKVPDRLAARPPFYEFPSEPLSEDITRMFKYSSNFTAEMLFKTLSARRDSLQGSWERSALIAGSWWKEHSLPGTPVFKNGSGMGDANRFSPAQVTALLSYAWRQTAWFPDYCAALSAAGLDGTLKIRFVKSRLKGTIRAKTGTLNAYGVNTLAGYILRSGGSPLSFAVFCSRTGHTQFEDWMLQEEILEKTADCCRPAKTAPGY